MQIICVLVYAKTFWISGILYTPIHSEQTMHENHNLGTFFYLLYTKTNVYINQIMFMIIKGCVYFGA